MRGKGKRGGLYHDATMGGSTKLDLSSHAIQYRIKSCLTRTLLGW